jgi:hypothetical protein
MHIILEGALRDPKEVMNSLLYINYCYNRDRSPLITVEQWGKVYGGKTMEMEACYQAELKMRRGEDGKVSII